MESNHVLESILRASDRVGKNISAQVFQNYFSGMFLANFSEHKQDPEIIPVKEELREMRYTPPKQKKPRKLW